MDQQLRVNKVRVNEVKEFSIDKSTKWLQSILLELLQDNGLGEDELSKSSILLNVRIDKEHFDDYGEVVFCEGKIALSYFDISVLTGELITQEMDVLIKCVFLEEDNQKRHKFDDEISIFFGEEEWDLYYYKNNVTDFKSVVHEYVFLNKNPYPGKTND